MVAVVAVTVVVAIVGSVVLVNALAGPTGPGGVILDTDGSAGPSDPNATPTPIPTPRPIPGHEVYGFLPYWEMNEAIPAHVRDTTLTTLALFSVTNKRNGTLDTGQNGYKKITGPIGRQLIRDAHDRKSRVELVYTSFGFERNQRFFGGKVATQDKVITALVEFADEIGVDGINVDVEQLDTEFVPSYGAFVARLRAALREEHAECRGLGGDHGQHRWGGDGRRGRSSRCRPDLHDGLRLPLAGIGAGGVVAARPARRG